MKELKICSTKHNGFGELFLLQNGPFCNGYEMSDGLKKHITKPL